LVGTRPNDGNAFDFVPIEGQQVAFIFEKHYGFPRRFQRQLRMFF